MARSSRLKPDERVKKYIDWNQLEVRDSKITSTEIREDAGDELVVAEQQLLGCKRVSVNFFLFCILVFEFMELF
ncbi:hypothetical protein GYH30_009693 [Glycine max]|nr:hypothetical protein GYH30_009693 [Glycine max]